MNASRPADGPEEREDGSWTTETLPMSLRKELLERELSKLGFRRSGASAPSHDGGSAQQQHHPQGGSEHPQAHESGGSHSE